MAWSDESYFFIHADGRVSVSLTWGRDALWEASNPATNALVPDSTAYLQRSSRVLSLTSQASFGIKRVPTQYHIFLVKVHSSKLMC